MVGDGTDLLVLLVSLSKSSTKILFIKPGKVHNPNKIYDIRKLTSNLGHLRQHLLFLHAVTGCDTTSALYGKGKRKSFDILKKSQDICDTVSVFDNGEASKDEVAKAGEAFLLCRERRNFKHWTGVVCMRTREQLQRCHLNLSFSYQHCHQQVMQLACTRLGCSTKYGIGMVTISLQSNGDGRVPKMG